MNLDNLCNLATTSYCRFTEAWIMFTLNLIKTIKGGVGGAKSLMNVDVKMSDNTVFSISFKIVQ